MLLVSPRAELSKSQQVPRDMVFVLDTSGSMRGKRMTQASNALKYCLTNLTRERPLRHDQLRHHGQQVHRQAAARDARTTSKQARKWVDGLEATGGTAINDALLAALDMRTERRCAAPSPSSSSPTASRPSARPTPTRSCKNVAKKNTGNTRIFTFGVGDDVNATMLDQLAEQSRAVSTYVRETRGHRGQGQQPVRKISNPVLANLKLTVGDDVKLSEVYPPQLPDLFHGSQLVVLGRYTGKGHAAVKLTGNVGKETKEFVYEVNFADKTGDDKSVRRGPVGPPQGRLPARPDSRQRREEGTGRRGGDAGQALRHHHAVHQLPGRAGQRAGRRTAVDPPRGWTSRTCASSLPGAGAAAALAAADSAAADGPAAGADRAPTAEGSTRRRRGSRTPRQGPKSVGKSRLDRLALEMNKAEQELRDLDANGQRRRSAKDDVAQAKEELRRAEGQLRNAAPGRAQLQRAAAIRATQEGTLGVNLSVNNAQLRNQTQTSQTATRWLGTRNALEIGGIWIDEAFTRRAQDRHRQGDVGRLLPHPGTPSRSSQKSSASATTSCG